MAFLVGLAVVLFVVTRAVLAPDPLSTDGQWFNYAPNSEMAFTPPGGRPPIAIAAAWTVAATLWTGIAVWLLGRGDD